MMWKLIFLCALIWLVVHIIKRTLNNTGKTTHPADKREGNRPHDHGGRQGHGGAHAPGNESPAETMVQCAMCRVHLPRSDAFLINGNFYCSQKHAEPS